MEKAPDAFRTISEVADDLNIPQHVLRFWESRFTQIRPMKRAGGRRYYRPDDVDLLRGIRHLLYGEGYTIRGVQRILREQGPRFVQGVWRPGALQPNAVSDEDGVEESDLDTPSIATNASSHATIETTDEDDDGDIEDADAEDDVKPELETAPAQPRLKEIDVQRLQSALDELRQMRDTINLVLKSGAA